MRDATISINPDPTRPVPADLEKGILWVGGAGINAESYKIYDISNLRIIDADEGTGLPNSIVRPEYRKKSVSNAVGQRKCLDCQKYESAPTCEQIERILESIRE